MGYFTKYTVFHKWMAFEKGGVITYELVEKCVVEVGERLE